MLLVQCLSKCRHDIADSLSIDEQSIELSMGMSGDFERAVRPHPCPDNSRL